MITVPTTLVLGAGASKPYGFPLGFELRQLLCDPGVLMGMCPLGFDANDVSVFCATFRKSEMPSIDAFLARRGGHKVGERTGATYAQIGKAAIAYLLTQQENSDILHMTRDDHWYQYLWSFMADSLASFGDNKLRIITFNYDRSLEQYLMTALQNSFGISPMDAASHLQKISILHVYGQLAAIPELSQPGQESRSYVPGLSGAAQLTAAANGIRVIDESRADDRVFDTAYSYLREAERICFLGFGFDETNVRRLRLDKLIRDYREQESGEPRIFATTIGLEEAERQKIVNRLNPTKYAGIPSYNPTHDNIHSHSNLAASRYLRAAGVFIS